MADKLLLAISVGPVQDFIAAARRTRDLWFGSYALSEVSKATARSLQNAGATLIFPASASIVSNKILAIVPAGAEPGEWVEKAREEAEKRWRCFAEETLTRIGKDGIDQDRWNQQIEDILELYAAWTPLISEYASRRQRVEGLLAGRKALRDFKPEKNQDCYGVPKSSLDGARESVIVDATKLQAYIKQGEQLDAIGLIKRIAGGKQDYPSLVRVATDSWIRGIASTGSTEDQAVLKEIIALCDNNQNMNQNMMRMDVLRWRQFEQFPYESSLLHPSRHHALRKDIGVGEDLVQSVQGKVADLVKKHGEPDCYLAVLVADGDRMGEVISHIDLPETHQAFSRQLSAFAQQARDIVARNQGALVFSGGDDVLAFLPVDTCLTAASELHETFGNLLQPFPDKQQQAPSLSVGIAIVHCLEPLEDSLQAARAAERQAKEPNRNGLAVHLHPRSGGDSVKLRYSWADQLQLLLHTWPALFQKRLLSEKVPYDLRLLARDYQGWSLESPAEMGELLRNEVRRVLIKKQPHGVDREQELLEYINPLIKLIDTVEDLLTLSTGLILASFIAKRLPAATNKQVQEGAFHGDVADSTS